MAKRRRPPTRDELISMLVPHIGSMTNMGALRAMAVNDVIEAIEHEGGRIEGITITVDEEAE